MSPRYLIECSCGEKIAVGAGQAGQEVRCDCGRAVQVPLLRELRGLPTVAAADPDRAKTSPSPRPRVLALLVFCGVLGTVLSLLLSGVLLFARSQMDPSWTHEAQRDYDGQIIDSLPADEMFNAWHDLRHEGLGEKQPTIHMLNRGSHAAMGKLLRWTLAAAVACGLFTAAIALFKPRSR